MEWSAPEEPARSCLDEWFLKPGHHQQAPRQRSASFFLVRYSRTTFQLSLLSVLSAWCAAQNVDPLSCDVASNLSFLQGLLDEGRTPSMFKVYVTTIVAYPNPIAGQSVGRHSLIVKFPWGARRQNPPHHHMVPTWGPGFSRRSSELATCMHS